MSHPHRPSHRRSLEWDRFEYLLCSEQRRSLCLQEGGRRCVSTVEGWTKGRDRLASRLSNPQVPSRQRRTYCVRWIVHVFYDSNRSMKSVCTLPHFARILADRVTMISSSKKPQAVTRGVRGAFCFVGFDRFIYCPAQVLHLLPLPHRAFVRPLIL